MPRTIEHLVETHRIAQARRDAGRPIWDHKIKLGDVFHAEHLDYEQRRDIIVRRLRKSAWLRDRDPLDWRMEIVENLASAEDADEFDYWWDELYDVADGDRVWIETH